MGNIIIYCYILRSNIYQVPGIIYYLQQKIEEHPETRQFFFSLKRKLSSIYVHCCMGARKSFFFVSPNPENTYQQFPLSSCTFLPSLRFGTEILNLPQWLSSQLSLPPNCLPMGYIYYVTLQKKEGGSQPIVYHLGLRGVHHHNHPFQRSTTYNAHERTYLYLYPSTAYNYGPKRNDHN